MHTTQTLPFLNSVYRKKKIRLVVNQNDSLTQAQARECLGWSADRPIIFAVRNLAQRMGLEELIKAITLVKCTYPDILLLISGKGPHLENIQTQINKLKVNKNVYFLGNIDEDLLPTCYQAANFSILPAQGLERLCLSLLESLAAGNPILGTPIGGMEDVLQPLHPDLVLKGHQATDLAQGIKEVLRGDRQLPSPDQCRRYVEKRYNWSAIAPQLRNIYPSAV